MILMYFTERPYRDVPEDELIKNRAYFGVPNKFFDREKGAQLYNEYLDEMVYAEDVGFDAIMLNEHHGTPFCMGAVMNVEASILARITKKVRSFCWAIRCRLSRIRCAWRRNWRRSIVSRTVAWSRMGARRRQRTDLQQRESRLQSRAFQRSARPDYSPHGRVPVRSDGRASTSITASSIRG